MKKSTPTKLLVIILVTFLLSFTLQRVFHLGLSDLQGWVESFGVFAPLVYSILLFLGLTVPFNPVSDFLLVNLAAFLFPPLLAIVATFAAHVAALIVNYWVARKFGWKILSKLLSDGEDEKLRDLSKKITPAQVFWLRWLLPLTAIGIDLVSYAAGLANLRFYQFFLASLIPWTLINILFFSFTRFVINRDALFFFIPGLVIIATPIVIYFWLKNAQKIKTEAEKHATSISKTLLGNKKTADGNHKK